VHCSGELDDLKHLKVEQEEGPKEYRLPNNTNPGILPWLPSVNMRHTPFVEIHLIQSIYVLLFDKNKIQIF
jgi:hypothetical protein